MNNSQQNKVLLSEVKKSLDEEESQLGFPIQSKLTQARFHAIDHGFLNRSQSVYNRQFAQNKLGFASLAMTVIVTLGLFTSYNSISTPTFKAETLQVSSPVVPQDLDELRTAESSEDTKEEVDIYDWLYEQYG